MMKTTAPYGSWKSPITSDFIVAGTVKLGDIRVDRDFVYWLEGRATEGGRSVLVQYDLKNGKKSDVTPAGYNVRTRVHEYGGAAYLVHNGTVFFSNFTDQRLYKQDLAKEGSEPQPLTVEYESCGMRYANAIFDPSRSRLICVREDHTQGGEALNTIVGIDIHNGTQTVLASGHDFYSSPKLSPDSKKLAWFTWDHPDMPWDGTELWVADMLDDGQLAEPQKITGSRTEAVQQPLWSPDGVLYFVSDGCEVEGACKGWWNLYRWDSGRLEVVCPKEGAEFGGPHWFFGSSNFAFDSATSIVCSYSQLGKNHLSRLNLTTLQLADLEVPFSSTDCVQTGQGIVAFKGGSPTIPDDIVVYDIQTQESKVIQRSSNLEIDPGYLSIPEVVEFPTENNVTAFGYYYPPSNKDFEAPSEEKPPVLVKIHGGPTASTSPVFNVLVQYWTSRGIAIFDVDYGGSTGYGREYRERLKGNWGIVDVDDCVNGAKFLVSQEKADAKRLLIDGGSAGGYTTLAALAFRDTFSAGASFYGVSDAEALAHETHKFEARYLDSLIGPYPEAKEVYIARSPIHATDSFSCPIIFFQGDEDKIVPPNQAEMMVEALKKKSLPVAYVLYQGEQHGFRKAENIKRTLDGELYFYSRVFGFQLADSVEPIEIFNLP